MKESIKNSFEIQSDRIDFAFNYTRDNFSPLKNLTAKEAYTHLKLSQSSFSAYRSGSEPSALVLRRLAEPCGFNIHWLVTGEGSMFANGFEHMGQLGHIRHIADENEKIAIGKDMLSNIEISPENLRFDTVLTSDMPNTASMGNVILVDVSSNAKEGLLLVEHENQRLIRQVQKRVDNEVLLVTETTGSTITYQENVKILGKVVWRAGKV